MKKWSRYFLLLLASLLLAIPADAAILRGSTVIATPQPANPAQPAIAATWGYNTRTFFDNFNSKATIDINNTLAAGYTWYVQSLILNTYPNNYNLIFPPASFTATGGVLKYTPNTPAHDPATGGNIYSAGWNGSGFTGTTIQPTGWYAEARIAYDPTLANNTNWFPAFWMWDKGIMTQSAANNPSFSGERYSEFDIFEAIPGSGTVTPKYTEYDWTALSTAINNTNTNLGVPTVDKKFHTYGILWVPMSKNSGTGLIQRYVDGIHIVGGDVTYSSSTISSQANTGATTGWMSGADASTRGFTVNLQTGENWPMYVDYVMVWQ